MKNNSAYKVFILFIAILFLPPSVFAVNRGVRIITKQGETVHLYKDYHALVIGITDYDHWPKLPNATKDATEVATKLESMGFKVKLLLDSTSREIEKAFGEAIYNTGKEKNRAILFYFAGHGETETLVDNTHMGFIIPKDCPLLEKDPFGFSSHAISMREIESVSMRIKSKHVLMLLDSCFSGSLFNLVRATPKNISEKSIQPVRQYITAGRYDELVPDTSMFKKVLLKGLDGDADLTGDGYVTGSELGMYLNENVINYTRSRQHPQYGKINNPDLDKGDFIFVPKKIQEKAAKRKDDADLQRLETEKKMLEEKKRLEAERLTFEKEKQKYEATIKELEENQRLAYISKDVVTPKVSLRTESKDTSLGKIKYIIAKNNFFEKNLFPQGSFKNEFIKNSSGTITDKSTGLMWQKAGSLEMLPNKTAKSYIQQLNKDKFAGYSDWRLPTIEELASLLKNKNSGSLYIDSIFDKKQSRCWSIDERLWDNGDIMMAWIADFSSGEIKESRRAYKN
ncbi:MAG: DUF1566 domain-containing protein, partial [Deltaproteobacteria bacterium]|nr:DUF1566 domain-containing protein [Deltaproteobacteria bacterium]